MRFSIDPARAVVGTARLWLLAILAMTTPTLGVPEKILLSESMDEVVAKLKAVPASASESKRGVPAHALVLDRETIDASAVSEMLEAISTLRAGRGSVIAVCPKQSGASKDGVAILALACDALVFEKGASLRGAQNDWCADRAEALKIADALGRLGGIDARLARRLVDCTKPLSWTVGAGFDDAGTGKVSLAEAGKPIELTASLLTKVGIKTSEMGSVDDAVKAIENRSVVARTASASKPPSTPKTPNSPATPSAPATPAASDPAVQTKVDAELAEYAEALSTLKKDLKEFDEFFDGRRGRWTTENKSLKEVWLDKSDNTRDQETKNRCERLQREMKEQISTMGSVVKTVEKLLKDKQHPTCQRLRANQVILDGLKVSFERNKVSDYEKFSPQVDSLR
jgi:hypothetical protein